VLRDDAGVFVRGSAKWYDHCLALTMEATACRDGLTLAVQSGVRNVWLETDCQQMVQLWQAGTNQRSTIVTILHEIRELSLLFLDFKSSFVSMNCNKIAHVLAKRVTGDTGWVVVLCSGLCVGPAILRLYSCSSLMNESP
jgi:hypothetical protein